MRRAGLLQPGQAPTQLRNGGIPGYGLPLVLTALAKPAQGRRHTLGVVEQLDPGRAART